VSQKKQSKKEDDFEKLKIPVTLNSDQLKLIESYKGILGNTKAEIIRNIVINWMLNNKFKGGDNEN
jgi:hypothetical protein